jgi:hypothetical protein
VPVLVYIPIAAPGPATNNTNTSTTSTISTTNTSGDFGGLCIIWTRRTREPDLIGFR